MLRIDWWWWWWWIWVILPGHHYHNWRFLATAAAALNPIPMKWVDYEQQFKVAAAAMQRALVQKKPSFSESESVCVNCTFCLIATLFQLVWRFLGIPLICRIPTMYVPGPSLNDNDNFIIAAWLTDWLVVSLFNSSSSWFRLILVTG